METVESFTCPCGSKKFVIKPVCLSFNEDGTVTMDNLQCQDCGRKRNVKVFGAEFINVEESDG